MNQDRLPRITNEISKVLAFLDSKAQESILHTEYSLVIAKFNQIDLEEKIAILTVCTSALSDEQLNKHQAIRITAVRVIVALLPMSLGTIVELLNRRLNRYDYETHFTLFCYLDWVQEMPDSSSLAKAVLSLVEDYLMTVPRRTARAAWMAADMLGSHWNEQEALPLLIKTVQGAKHSVGRLGSLLGLGKVLNRLPIESNAYKHLLKTLHQVSLFDDSKYVKEEARTLIDHPGKLSKR